MDAQPATTVPRPKAQIEISNWKPLVKNTLKGFFSLTLPSGMILHDCMLHEKNQSRWISLPARPWTDNQGKTQFARFIEFSTPEIETHFKNQVLAALDRHFAEAKQ